MDEGDNVVWVASKLTFDSFVMDLCLDNFLETKRTNQSNLVLVGLDSTT